MGSLSGVKIHLSARLYLSRWFRWLIWVSVFSHTGGKRNESGYNSISGFFFFSLLINEPIIFSAYRLICESDEKIPIKHSHRQRWHSQMSRCVLQTVLQRHSIWKLFQWKVKLNDRLIPPAWYNGIWCLRHVKLHWSSKYKHCCPGILQAAFILV